MDIFRTPDRVWKLVAFDRFVYVHLYYIFKHIQTQIYTVVIKKYICHLLLQRIDHTCTVSRGTRSSH